MSFGEGSQPVEGRGPLAGHSLNLQIIFSLICVYTVFIRHNRDTRGKIIFAITISVPRSPSDGKDKPSGGESLKGASF